MNVTKPINAVTDNAPYAGLGHWNFLRISLFSLIFLCTAVVLTHEPEQIGRVGGCLINITVFSCNFSKPAKGWNFKSMWYYVNAHRF